MKTLGIIVEYNPLHNGHVLHFEQSKRHTEADAVIAVMSGNFLQRGEPALVDKWARTEMALRMGVDLVIELPVAFSAQPAEWFAYGAVSALDATGVVDTLCFGSESGEIDWLITLADQLAKEPKQLQTKLKHALSEGASYPTAYNQAIFALMEGRYDPAWKLPTLAIELAKPNNTLGLHYLIALRRLNSSIRPATIERKQADFHDTKLTNENIASATAIRSELLKHQGDLSIVKQFIPQYTYEILQRELKLGKAPMYWDRFSSVLFHNLLVTTVSDLQMYAEVSEGLEFRIKKVLRFLPSDEPLSLDRLLEQLKTKRYTRTKLQRMLLRILLEHRKEQLTKETLRQGVPYLRVLGMSETGRLLLRKMKKSARVPIVTKPAKHDDKLLQLDIQAAQAYAAAFPRATGEDLTREFTQSPLGGSDAK